MVIIDRCVDFLILQNVISKEEKKIYTYGLFVFFYNLLLVINIIVDGIILDRMFFSLIFLLFWIPYCIFVGGIHCSTPQRCCVFFNVLFLIALILFEFININCLVSINITLFIVQLYKEYKNKVFLTFWIIYACILFIIDATLASIISIAYLCNSILKIYQLYTKHKYLF